MEGPRVVVLIILLLFIFLTPDQPARRRFILSNESIKERRQAQLNVLTNTTYGQFNPEAHRYLNLSGFREGDHYQWNSLAAVQDATRKQFQAIWSGQDPISDRPVYEQITGEIRGDFTRRVAPIPASGLNLSALDPRKEYMTPIFERNITEVNGELSMTLFDSNHIGSHKTAAIRADLSIWTPSAPGNGWQARVQGVHLPSGQVIMSTTSSKFNAFFALPHFALTPDGFNASIEVMNQTVHKIWDRTFEDMNDGLAFAPQCELIVWLQPRPQGFQGLDAEQTRTFLHQVETELQAPQGAPIGQPPPLAFSAVIFSPDCGYVLESDSVYGPKVEAYWSLAQRLVFAFVTILGLQISLLKRQMEKASTPSTRSRIAYQSIVIAALGDGLLLFALIALLMIDEAAFLIIASAAFLACIHVAFLEVKFVFDIWTIQVGEPARAEQERQRRAAAAPSPARPTAPATTTTPSPVNPTSEIPVTPAPTNQSVPGTFPTQATTAPTNPNAPAGLPLPVVAPRPTGAVPFIVPSDQDSPFQPEIPSTRASFAAIYSRFYFSLVMLMFFSLWAMSWPRTLRSIYASFLVFAYFSFWWPQIYRNVVRNCRKALSWEYVIGISVLRAIPVLYWYFADNNLLAIDTSPRTAFALLGWLWIQVAILASQQFLGPRLLVRESWCPPAYNYHPILREDDVEANGMSIGLLASASEAKDKDDKTRKVFDCAICMNEIDVPVLLKAEPGGIIGRGTGATWLEQRNYMVTPCRHIFHADCLEGWMNLRLVCPVCRESLPPL